MCKEGRICILSVMVLPTELESAQISLRNFKFLVYSISTTVADECLIILTGIGWFIVLVISSSAKTTKLLSVSWTKRLLLDYCTSDNEAVFCNFGFGVREGTRNPDPLIKSQMLCRLSYTDICPTFIGKSATFNMYFTFIHQIKYAYPLIYPLNILLFFLYLFRKSFYLCNFYRALELNLPTDYRLM